MAWTTDDLVSEVRLKAWLPDADDLSASDLLSFADDALRSLIAALVKTGREERWVERSTVAAASRVAIPRRALGGALRTVHAVSPAGDEHPFTFVTPAEAWMFGTPDSAGWGYIEGDELVLLGTPPSGWSIRFRYLRRPSRLVPVSECRTATNQPAADTLSLASSTPAAWQSTGAILDLVSGSEPHGPVVDDAAVLAYINPNLQFTAALPTVDISQVAGTEPDYVCLRDTTCLPPIPSSLRSALVWLTVGELHEAQKNVAQAQGARDRAAEHMGAARAVLEPRVASQTPAIVRRSGPLRGRR